MIMAAVQEEGRCARREYCRVRLEAGVNECEMEIGTGDEFGEMGSRIRPRLRRRIPCRAVAIGSERRRAERRYFHRPALDRDLRAGRPVERASAWICNVRDERRPELPHLSDEGLRIDDIAVVIADVDDRWRETREDPQHFKIDLAVIAQAKGIAQFEDIAIDDDDGLRAPVRRDEIADR